MAAYKTVLAEGDEAAVISMFYGTNGNGASPLGQNLLGYHMRHNIQEFKNERGETYGRGVLAEVAPAWELFLRRAKDDAARESLEMTPLIDKALAQVDRFRGLVIAEQEEALGRIRDTICPREFPRTGEYLNNDTSIDTLGKTLRMASTEWLSTVAKTSRAICTSPSISLYIAKAARAGVLDKVLENPNFTEATATRLQEWILKALVTGGESVTVISRLAEAVVAKGYPFGPQQVETLYGYFKLPRGRATKADAARIPALVAVPEIRRILLRAKSPKILARTALSSDAYTWLAVANHLADIPATDKDGPEAASELARMVERLPAIFMADMSTGDLARLVAHPEERVRDATRNLIVYLPAGEEEKPTMAQARKRARTV